MNKRIKKKHAKLRFSMLVKKLYKTACNCTFDFDNTENLNDFGIFFDIQIKDGDAECKLYSISDLIQDKE